MKNDLMQRLHELIEEAYTAVKEMLKEKTVITLLTDDDVDENENMKRSINDDVPDFPHYDKYDYLEQVAMQELRLDGDTVIITGVYKGENFPKKITTTLCQLDGYYAIALANFLCSEMEAN